jgi:hypothetical protein
MLISSGKKSPIGCPRFARAGEHHQQYEQPTHHHPVRPTVHRRRVIAGIELIDRRAIVTGSASGIGVEAALALAGAKAEVSLTVRDLEAGERIAADLIGNTGNKRILVAPINISLTRHRSRHWSPTGADRCTCW